MNIDIIVMVLYWIAVIVVLRLLSGRWIWQWNFNEKEVCEKP